VISLIWFYLRALMCIFLFCLCAWGLGFAAIAAIELAIHLMR